MPNNSNYNQHNQNLRNQGGQWVWVADVDSEIYANLATLENTDNNQQNQINDIMNNQLPQKQNQINDHENRLQNQQQNINNLSNDISSKQNQINDIMNNQLPQKQNQINEIQNELHTAESNISIHETKIREFDEKIKLFSKETIESLGKAFGDNSIELSKSMRVWLIYSIVCFGVIFMLDVALITVLKTIYQIEWYYIAGLNGLMLTLLYFIVSQYVYYKKLSFEYKNRKVVAESYIGIVNTLTKTEKGGEIITQIVADTLFSRNITDQGNDLPLKDALRFGEKVLELKKG